MEGKGRKPCATPTHTTLCKYGAKHSQNLRTNSPLKKKQNVKPINLTAPHQQNIKPYTNKLRNQKTKHKTLHQQPLHIQNLLPIWCPTLAKPARKQHPKQQNIKPINLRQAPTKNIKTYKPQTSAAPAPAKHKTLHHQIVRNKQETLQAPPQGSRHKTINLES